MSFKPGDIVVLKSGGPRMVVTMISEPDKKPSLFRLPQYLPPYGVCCDWMSLDGEPYSGVFKPETLIGVCGDTRTDD